MQQVNPLNLFNLRRVTNCPPHFYVVDFDASTTDKKISDWIWENLHGRFYLNEALVKGTDGKKVLLKRAAFEIHGEGTLFALSLADINKF